ncbi:MAG TPA: choice-of-anchor D domain-containing protein [Solirubrobacteraceae bacterium]
MLQLNSPYPFMQTMFAEAARMHASAIRLDVAPALIFPSQGGAADFGGLDEVMALAQEYHLRVLADLFTIPPWMAGCSAIGAVARSRCAPDDEADYGSIITRIVSHADPIIRDWEIWNEPDSSAFFSGSPQQYADMLRTAHDAIKAVDPAANVLLGGLSGSSAMSWLAQVFAAPGADAAGAFDIANVHERSWLDGLISEFVGWRWFLSAHGFTGTIWVTEHGYPADPSFQFDPHYRGGESSQAAFLRASIPSLVDAGAAMVFVTERDNLGGQFASEGLLGGDVSDPPVSDPYVIERPAFAAVAHIADCYTLLGRDCPGVGPAASPVTKSVPVARLGSSAPETVNVSDPGSAPLELGPAALAGAPGLSIADDACPAVLEPDQRCAITVRFTPVTPGRILGELRVPSDAGDLSVTVGAVAISVSGLSSPQLPAPKFAKGPGGDGVGIVQHLLLTLTNPMPAVVHVGVASLTGLDAVRFRLVANTCRGALLAPNARCRVTVSFVPRRLGVAHAVLTLRGDGIPLTVRLAPTASAPPAIELLSAQTAPRRCPAPRMMVLTSQPAVLTWRAVRSPRPLGSRCASSSNARSRQASRVLLRGRARTGDRLRAARGRRGYAATVTLPAALPPGMYRLTMAPDNAHGRGAPRAIWVTVPG